MQKPDASTRRFIRLRLRPEGYPAAIRIFRTSPCAPTLAARFAELSFLNRGGGSFRPIIRRWSFAFWHICPEMRTSPKHSPQEKTFIGVQRPLFSDCRSIKSVHRNGNVRKL